MAQLVEQLIRNEQVVGSSPTISSSRKSLTLLRSGLSFLFNFIHSFQSHLFCIIFTYRVHNFYCDRSIFLREIRQSAVSHIPSVYWFSHGSISSYLDKRAEIWYHIPMMRMVTLPSIPAVR